MSLKGAAGMSAYFASTAAVVGFTRALAVELAGHTIRANSLCPGWVDTPFNAPVIGFQGGQSAHDESVQMTVPLKREAAPSEMASWLAFPHLR